MTSGEPDPRRFPTRRSRPTAASGGRAPRGGRPRSRRSAAAAVVATAAGATKQEAYALEIDGRAFDSGGIRRLRPRPLARGTIDVAATDRLAGQGLDRRHRERVVFSGLVRDRTARPGGLDRSLHRARGDRALGPRAASHVPARRTTVAGQALRHGARDLRDLPQRPARRRHGVGSRVHQLPHHAARPGRTTSARSWWRATTPGRSCSRTVGGAGASVSSSRSTATAARSPFSGQLHADEIVVATGPDWESSNGPLLSPTSWRGRSRTTGPGPRHGGPSRSPITTCAPWPTPRRRPPVGWRSSDPSPSPAPGPIARWSTSGRTSTAGCA